MKKKISIWLYPYFHWWIEEEISFWHYEHYLNSSSGDSDLVDVKVSVGGAYQVSPVFKKQPLGFVW